MQSKYIPHVFCNAVLLMFTFLACSQSPFYAGISFGAITSQVDGDGYGGYNKSGIHGGVWVSRNFSDNYSYLLEISYRPKGSKNSLKSNEDEIDYYKLNLHYVEVPITIRYYHKNYFFDISTGIAYLAKEYVEGYVEGFFQSSDITGFNKFDFIVAAGIGLKINDYWHVKARFTYSVFDAAKQYKPPQFIRHNWQNNNDLSVGLYRTIGTKIY